MYIHNIYLYNQILSNIYPLDSFIYNIFIHVFLKNETTDQTASESCQSSDEDSEVDVVLGMGTENHSITELFVSSQAGTSSPTAHIPLIDHLDMPVSIIMSIIYF